MARHTTKPEDAAQTKDTSQTCTGVLLVNTGTPEAPKPHAVRRYLSRFLMDKRIRPMHALPWWFILHLAILPKRGKASAEKYREIWTKDGSPFVLAHEKLALALERALQDESDEVYVRYAMSYSKPRVRDALRELRGAGCTKVVVLPLYPQSAFSTTGAVRDAVDCALRRLHWRPDLQFVDNYHQNATYISALAALIRHTGFDPTSNDRLLFSFHSIPCVDIEAGDTYELQTSASSLLIASELGLERKRWTIGYQCRFDKGRDWLEPYTTDVLRRWAFAGEGRVFMVCPNFAVDCLETLYDVNRELKPHYYRCVMEAGNNAGERSFTYVPCLNSSKAQVKVLAAVLQPYVEGE